MTFKEDLDTLTEQVTDLIADFTARTGAVPDIAVNRSTFSTMSGINTRFSVGISAEAKSEKDFSLVEVTLSNIK